jgi:hypothetical protein
LLRHVSILRHGRARSIGAIAAAVAANYSSCDPAQVAPEAAAERLFGMVG